MKEFTQFLCSLEHFLYLWFDLILSLDKITATAPITTMKQLKLFVLIFKLKLYFQKYSNLKI